MEKMTNLLGTTSALPGSFMWKESMVDKLIVLFRDNPCLYDSNYDDYHDKDQKKASFEKIAEELGISSDKVIRKLKSLRTQYAREKQKERLVNKDPDRIHPFVSKWIHYPNLQFLDSHIRPRKTESTLFLGEDVDMVGNSFSEENGELGEGIYEALPARMDQIEQLNGDGQSLLTDARALVTRDAMATHVSLKNSGLVSTPAKMQGVSQGSQVLHVLHMSRVSQAQASQGSPPSLVSMVSLAQAQSSQVSLVSQESSQISSLTPRVSQESIVSQIPPPLRLPPQAQLESLPSQAPLESRVSLVSQVPLASQVTLASQLPLESHVSLVPASASLESRMSLVSQATPQPARISLVSQELPQSQVLHVSQIQPPASQVFQVPHTVKREHGLSIDDDRPLKRVLTTSDAITESWPARALREPDRFSVFGQYIACELRELGDLEMERWAKQQIVKIMCQAQEKSFAANLDPS